MNNRVHLARWVSMDGLVVIPFITTGIVIAIITLLLLLSGANPVSVLVELLLGVVGTQAQLAASVNRMTPLLIAGAGAALALRAGAFNLGIEGQIALGGLAAAFFGMWMGDLPKVLAIPMVLLLSGFAGMVWAGLAGLLSLWRGINEVIITLLSNFIALLFVSAAVTGPLNHGQGFPATEILPTSVYLPTLFGTTMHSGVLIGVAAAVGGWSLLWHTPLGYRLRIGGANPEVARYLRFNPHHSFMIGILLSGTLAGIAGGVEIIGTRYRLFDGFSLNMGWNAIAVALMGGLNPLGVIPSAFFFGGLWAATGALQRRSGIPVSLATIIQGLTMLNEIIIQGHRPNHLPD